MNNYMVKINRKSESYKKEIIVSGAQIILNILGQKGIKHIFGVPGRESEGILFNEYQDINLVLTAVENTAGFAAYAYTQVTGKTQVVFTTIGPGVANMANVIYSTCSDRIPVIFICVQVETDRIFHNHTHQCIDAVAMYRPITKYAHEIANVEEIKNCLETAFEKTQEEPKGPALISVPIDMLKAKIDLLKAQKKVVLIRPIQGNNRPSSMPNMDIKKIQNVKGIPEYIQSSNYTAQKLIDINKAAKLISSCQQPLLYVANEIIRSNSVDEVQELCNEYNIPAIFAYDTKGVLPSNHELNYFTCSSYAEGILGLNPNRYIFPKEVDCIVSLGYDYKDDVFPEKHFRYGEGGNHRLLINLSGFMPDKIVTEFDFHINGNINTNLRELLKCLKQKPAKFNPPYNISPLREAMSQKIKSTNLETPPGKINIVEVIKSINKHSAVLVSDVGTFRHYAVLFSEILKPNYFLTSAGSSSFGTGLPFGFGAALAHKNEKIIVLAGDGGFNSSIGDLRTLKKYNTDIVIIVLNNNKNGLINIYQQKGHNGKINKDAVDHSNADFVAIAKGYGCEGARVCCSYELDCAIKDAFDKGGPWVIEVPIYYPEEDIKRLTCSQNLG